MRPSCPGELKHEESLLEYRSPAAARAGRAPSCRPGCQATWCRTASLARPLVVSAGRVEGIDRFTGGVVVGTGAKQCADAVAVELLTHRREGRADGDSDVPLVKSFHEAAEAGGCGVVDVPDCDAVQDHPPQRVTVAHERRDVIDEPGGVGEVETRAEPVSHQSRLGPGAWHDRFGLP